jgi:hypothetical protein
VIHQSEEPEVRSFDELLNQRICPSLQTDELLSYSAGQFRVVGAVAEQVPAGPLSRRF